MILDAIIDLLNFFSFFFQNENNLDMIEKRNNHGLKCVQYETQLVYANLEAFVFILSSLGNIQCKLSADVSRSKCLTQ